MEIINKSNQSQAKKLEFALDGESNTEKCKRFNLDIKDWEPNWQNEASNALIQIIAK